MNPMYDIGFLKSQTPVGVEMLSGPLTRSYSLSVGRDQEKFHCYCGQLSTLKVGPYV